MSLIMVNKHTFLTRKKEGKSRIVVVRIVKHTRSAKCCFSADVRADRCVHVSLDWTDSFMVNTGSHIKTRRSVLFPDVSVGETHINSMQKVLHMLILELRQEVPKKNVYDPYLLQMLQTGWWGYNDLTKVS